MQEIKCPKCGEVFQVEESGYAAIVKQVRDKEFLKEISDRELKFETEKNNAILLTKMEVEKNFNEQLSKKNVEITELKSKMDAEITSKDLSMKDTVAEKDKKIFEEAKSPNLTLGSCSTFSSIFASKVNFTFSVSFSFLELLCSKKFIFLSLLSFASNSPTVIFLIGSFCSCSTLIAFFKFWFLLK